MISIPTRCHSSLSDGFSKKGKQIRGILENRPLASDGGERLVLLPTHTLINPNLVGSTCPGMHLADSSVSIR